MGQSSGHDYNLAVPLEDDDDSVEARPAPSPDMVFVYGQAADQSYTVVRRRGDNVEVGAIRELETGKPIHGQVVRLERRREHPLLFDVKTELDTTTAPAVTAARSGPAQVATEEYRTNWDAIFGKDVGKKEALN